MRVLAAALLMQMMAVPASAQSSFSGYWFGHQPHNMNAAYFLTIRPDGTFETHHRRCLKGQAFDHFVTGSWILSGDLITYHVATVRGLPRPRVDLFRLISVDAEQQTAIFLPLNLTYVAHRVAADFVLPSCTLVS
jgi:hypothetical protein